MHNWFIWWCFVHKPDRLFETKGMRSLRISQRILGWCIHINLWGYVTPNTNMIIKWGGMGCGHFMERSNGYVLCQCRHPSFDNYILASDLNQPRESRVTSFFKAVTWSRNIPGGFAKYNTEIIPCNAVVCTFMVQ